MSEYERGAWAAIQAMQEVIGASDYAYGITDDIVARLGLGNDNEYDDEEDE